MIPKKKRHRVVDPRKFRAAAGGDPGWYANFVPTPGPYPSKKEIVQQEGATEVVGAEVPFSSPRILSAMGG